MRHLFLEGQTDYQFVLSALRFLSRLELNPKLDTQKKYYHTDLKGTSIGIFDCKGVTNIEENIGKRLEFVLTQLIDDEHHICVICDKDDKKIEERIELLTNPLNKKFNPIDYTPEKLGKINFHPESNIRYGLFIYPDNQNAGCLETLLTQYYLKDLAKSDCFNDFVKCSNLAITPENNPKIYFNLVIGSLGLEYNKAFIDVDFSDELFEPILSFLEEFIS